MSVRLSQVRVMEVGSDWKSRMYVASEAGAAYDWITEAMSILLLDNGWVKIVGEGYQLLLPPHRIMEAFE